MGAADHPFDELDPVVFRADRVLKAVLGFADVVADRNAVPAVEDVLDGAEFVGGHVEQAPEYFTEQHLIEPCLEALGLAPRARPVDLVAEERQRPDYELLGLPEECLGIAESKALGRESSEGAATEEVAEYLRGDVFLKTLRRRQVDYSVGIATDGLLWVLVAKDAERDLQVNITEWSLEPIVSFALTYANSTETPDAGERPALRRELAESFAANFAVETLPDTVAAELDLQARHRDGSA
jgi:hypothetical protein